LSLNFKDIKKILIPTDGSVHSGRAAEYGISIAKLVGAQILTVFVVDEVVLDQIGKITDREAVERELKVNGEGYVGYVCGNAQKEGVVCASLILKGRPFEVIVHLARDQNIDLIVMGTYGRRGPERILIGSVAERVLEYVCCPVLVTK
jgi:nucleotide-binding universal stress UspA family protein